jgi:hypothetical protein
MLVLLILVITNLVVSILLFLAMTEMLVLLTVAILKSDVFMSMTIAMIIMFALKIGVILNKDASID